MMRKIIKLALTDFKLIFRDPSLRAFLAFPIILVSVFVWFLPQLVEKYDFLTPYIPIFLATGVLSNTQMFNFVSSMVLIDEKETEVAKIYGIVPLAKVQYITSRFLIPYLITVVLNIILLQVQPFYYVALGNNLLISFLTAMIVLVYVMAMNSIAQNRMQGMIYIKAFNIIILFPVAAFFVPEKIKHLFWIFPTHWIFQSVDGITKGASIGWMVSIGFVFFALLFLYVTKRFMQKHFI